MFSAVLARRRFYQQQDRRKDDCHADAPALPDRSGNTVIASVATDVNGDPISTRTLSILTSTAAAAATTTSTTTAAAENLGAPAQGELARLTEGPARGQADLVTAAASFLESDES